MSRIQINFNLEQIPKKIIDITKIDFQTLFDTLKKHSDKKLTLNEQDEWEEYFNEKKISVQDLEKEINQLDDKIDEMVYNIYGLSDEDIEIIEKELNN